MSGIRFPASLGLLCIIFLFSCKDVVSHKYSTYQDAKADHLFDKGWLPDILPPSTTDIVTKNDLDSNVSRGHFVIPKTDMPVFLGKLTLSAGDKYRYQLTGHKDWWVFVVGDNGYVSYTLER